MAADFDGTLARPSLDPWRASIVPRAERALQRLAGAGGVHVALISGRTVADLAARAAIAGASYHGDHGAERALAPAAGFDGPLAIARESAPPDAVAAADQVKAGVPRLVDEPWLVLEDKGAAVTFHFRAAPDIESARARVAAAVDALDPGARLERWGGRRSLELRPRGAATKASTLVALMAQVDAAGVIMLGDDAHDAGAFDALRAARAAGRCEGLAMAVVSPAAETAAMAARADLVLASVEAVAELLEDLADAATAGPAPAPRPRSSRGWRRSPAGRGR